MNETGGHYAKLSTVFVTIGFYEVCVCVCVHVCVLSHVWLFAT